jgi:multidrug efflux pump
LREVFRTLLETLLIVVIVIFLFLGRFRSVLVPAVAIPVSLIGAIFLMQVFGFTVNLPDAPGDRALGRLVVDDAIVVVENVERRLRKATRRCKLRCWARERSARSSPRRSRRAAVYAPDRRPAGRAHRLALPRVRLHAGGRGHDLGVVALTLSPVMSAKLLTAEGENKGFTGHINRNFDRLRNLYGRALDKTLSRVPRCTFLDRDDPALLPDVQDVVASWRRPRTRGHLRHHGGAVERDHRRDGALRAGSHKHFGRPEITTPSS